MIEQEIMGMALFGSKNNKKTVRITEVYVIRATG
jgi:hypothetical protein